MFINYHVEKRNGFVTVQLLLKRGARFFFYVYQIIQILSFIFSMTYQNLHTKYIIPLHFSIITVYWQCKS